MVGRRFAFVKFLNVSNENHMDLSLSSMVLYFGKLNNQPIIPHSMVRTILGNDKHTCFGRRHEFSVQLMD